MENTEQDGRGFPRLASSEDGKRDMMTGPTDMEEVTGGGWALSDGKRQGTGELFQGFYSGGRKVCS